MKLCVDLGATNVKSGLVENYEILQAAITPTNVSAGCSGVVASLKESIDKLICPTVSAICVSSAGKIDSDRGVVTYATDNLPGYAGFDICAWVKETYALPAVALNDGFAALLGEIALDKSYASKRVVMLTFGSGVGGAYAVNGSLKADEKNDFALFGHISIVPDGKKCNCGKFGCAEQYLSGRAINRFALAAGIEKDRLFAEYERRNAAAIELVGRLKEYLKITLDRISFVAPFEVCILGGGVVDGMGESFGAFTASLGYDIRRAKAGNNAGMLGAYYFGEERL